MLRITRVEDVANHPTIKLEGKLLNDWTGEVRETIANAAALSELVRLDLSALTYVDAEGIRLLNDLLQGGADLIACSPFVATLLHREASR